MTEYKGDLYFSFDANRGMSITLGDSNANADIIKIQIEAADLIRLFANQANVPCKFIAANLDKIGRYHKHKTFEFPLPKNFEKIKYTDRKTTAYKIAVELAPKNYEPDSNFSSQNSFFEKDGKPWARCTIRKYCKKKPKRKTKIKI
jgi:hypothetical protein